MTPEPTIGILFQKWPQSCEEGCPETVEATLSGSGRWAVVSTLRKLVGRRYDEYVSDPANPVPYSPRPVTGDEGAWRTWLLHDQRFVDGRPDVLTYVTEPLTDADEIGRRTHRASHRVHHRDGLGLGGEADRRLSRLTSPRRSIPTAPSRVRWACNRI